MAAYVDPFLCIIFGLVVLGSAFISWYFFHKYQHPFEAETGATWPQVVVVVSLMFTLMTVLMPPLDIANGNGGIPMDVLWYVVFYIQATMIFLVIPYSIFYYGAYDSFGKLEQDGTHVQAQGCQPRAWRTAICYTTITAGITLTLIGVVWLFLGIAELDVVNYSAPLIQIPSSVVPMGCGYTRTPLETSAECDGSENILEMDVTFPVYTIAITAFLGWTLFAVFAGIGLFAIPMDLINFYRSRVRFMTPEARQEFKQKLGERARTVHKVLRDFEAEMDELLKNGEEQLNREQGEELQEFLKEKEFIFSQYQNFKVCEDARRGIEHEENACMHCLGLVGGILSIVVSILWTLHICLYMFPEPPVYGFLNVFLVELDKVWSLFGVTLYALFSFYMMLCVLKGNSKWGLSIGCCTLHPMEYQNTMMQSFLVNTLLLALCSFSVVQFCMQAFKEYGGPNSAATLIFNVAARNLRGLTVLYNNNVFTYILLILAALTFAFLLCCPPKKLDFQARMNEAIDLDARGKDWRGNANRGNKRFAQDIEVELENRGVERN